MKNFSSLSLYWKRCFVIKIGLLAFGSRWRTSLCFLLTRCAVSWQKWICLHLDQDEDFLSAFSLLNALFRDRNGFACVWIKMKNFSLLSPFLEFQSEFHLPTISSKRDKNGKTLKWILRQHLLRKISLHGFSHTFSFWQWSGSNDFRQVHIDTLSSVDFFSQTYRCLSLVNVKRPQFLIHRHFFFFWSFNRTFWLFSFFFVACYKSQNSDLSVRPLVSWSVCRPHSSGLWPHCSCPKALVTGPF